MHLDREVEMVINIDVPSRAATYNHLSDKDTFTEVNFQVLRLIVSHDQGIG